MYIFQCIKPGICDIYLPNQCQAMGCDFRKSEYIARDAEATKSLKRAMIFETKSNAMSFIRNDVLVGMGDVDEPIPEFKLVSVTISLK